MEQQLAKWNELVSSIRPSNTFALQWTLKSLIVYQMLTIFYRLFKCHLKDTIISWVVLFLSAWLFLELDCGIEKGDIWMYSAEFATLTIVIGVASSGVLNLISEVVTNPCHIILQSLPIFFLILIIYELKEIKDPIGTFNQMVSKNSEAIPDCHNDFKLEAEDMVMEDDSDDGDLLMSLD